MTSPPSPPPLVELLARPAFGLPAEDLSAWGLVGDGRPAPFDLALRAVCGIASFVSAAAVCTGDGDSLRDEAEAACCQGLAALTAVLACAEPGTGPVVASSYLPQLDVAFDLLASRANAAVLSPLVQGTGTAALQFPLVVLLSCADQPSAFSVRHVLELARYDLLTATGALLAALDVEPPATACGISLTISTELRTHLWYMIHQLTTPQCAVEMYAATDQPTDMEGDPNDTSIHELNSRQVAHAHRVALCLVQLCAFDAANRSASEMPMQRVSVVGILVSLLHNLVASPQLVLPGELLARHLSLRWPIFGLRLLAPYIRRLVGAASSGDGSDVAGRAERALRRSLGTLGWLLHHSSALRDSAAAFCAEIALRSVRQELSTETVAMAVIVAANSGCFGAGGPLDALVGSIDDDNKALLAVEVAKVSKQRLQLTPESFTAVVALGLLHDESPGAEDREAFAQDGKTFVVATENGFSFQFTFPQSDEDAAHLNGFNPYASNGIGVGHTDDRFDGWEEVQNLGEDDDTIGRQCCITPQDASATLLPMPGAPPWSSLTLSDRAPATVLLCSAPTWFRCSVDGRICSDPVRAPDGRLFDHGPLVSWLKWRQLCPITGSPMAVADLVPDPELKVAITDWVAHGTPAAYAA